MYIIPIITYFVFQLFREFCTKDLSESTLRESYFGVFFSLVFLFSFSQDIGPQANIILSTSKKVNKYA
jgi:hypothetical protein